MKKLIRFSLVLLAFEVMVSCSSQQRITKWSAPTLRVMLNPEGVPSDAYVRIQNALIQSHKYFVVDRAQAFQAVVREQNMTRVEASEGRFDDKEKFARLKRLYGVGGVIQAHQQCVTQHSVISGDYVHCFQYLSLVSTNTGEVIAAGQAEADAPEALWNSPQGGMSPDWSDAVEALNQAVPTHFEEQQWTPEMKHYKEVNAEEANREREAK